MRRLSLPTLLVTLPVLVLPAWAVSPADRVPSPRAERCVPFDAEPEEGEMASPEGLGYAEVTQALNAVLQAALYCPQPAGRSHLKLTFELIIGCDGLVETIEAEDTDDAPGSYVSCVSSVIEKADFPAHDMEDGMHLTYPVNVSW